MLFVILSRDFSGAEISQAPIVRAAADSLVACPAGSEVERYARELGARTVPLVYRPIQRSKGWVETLRSAGRAIRTAIELRRRLRDHEERRAVYAIGLRSAMVTSLAAVGLRRRVVWSVHDLLPPPPLRGIVRAIAWLGASRAICPSRFIERDFVGQSARLERLTTVVVHGVELPDGPPVEQVYLGPAVAVVGQISPVKRTEMAIDVAEILAGRGSPPTIVVIGSAQFRSEDFDLEENLRKRVAADPELDSIVRFLGRQADVGSSLGACDMLLHCRPDEPFGMVLIEAMAHGVPPVAPAAGGPAEIVEDGVTGLLYRPGDAEHAADCVCRLIDDPVLAETMGANGRQVVASRFSTRGQLRATSQLLHEIEPASEHLAVSGDVP